MHVIHNDPGAHTTIIKQLRSIATFRQKVMDMQGQSEAALQTVGATMHAL